MKEMNQNSFRNLSYLKIQEMLGKFQGEDRDRVIDMIIKLKGSKLTSLDILTIYEAEPADIKDVTFKIIEAKKEKLEPNDLVYMSHFYKNNEELKSWLSKYLPQNVIDANAKSWETNLRESIRKIIKNEIFI